MKLVYVESPYAARAPFSVDDHVRYAQLCMADSFARGEAPFLSHLLYTQSLSDAVPEQRRQGIEAGFVWAAKADSAAFYYDLGLSRGMIEGFGRHAHNNLKTEFRRLFSTATGRGLRAGYLTLDEALTLQ